MSRSKSDELGQIAIGKKQRNKKFDIEIKSCSKLGELKAILKEYEDAANVYVDMEGDLVVWTKEKVLGRVHCRGI